MSVNVGNGRPIDDHEILAGKQPVQVHESKVVTSSKQIKFGWSPLWIKFAARNQFSWTWSLQHRQKVDCFEQWIPRFIGNHKVIFKQNLKPQSKGVTCR